MTTEQIPSIVPFTDSELRILTVLSGGKLTTKQLLDQIEIGYTYLVKLLVKLKARGYVASVRQGKQTYYYIKSLPEVVSTTSSQAHPIPVETSQGTKLLSALEACEHLTRINKHAKPISVAGQIICHLYYRSYAKTVGISMTATAPEPLDCRIALERIITDMRKSVVILEAIYNSPIWSDAPNTYKKIDSSEREEKALLEYSKAIFELWRTDKL